MMNTVRDTFHAIGDRGSDLAGKIGSDTVGLARRFGNGTAGLARRVGPRRGLIALAVIAAAIGGSIVIMRIRRARNARNEHELGTSNSPAAFNAGTSSSRDRAHPAGSMPGTH